MHTSLLPGYTRCMLNQPQSLARFLTTLAAVLLLGVMDAQAANRYVRAGAAGANNGTDWTNAYTTLPATLTRGDVYYVADGTYGDYTFSTPASGTTLITIKKAAVADHGTATGWLDTYGDGQTTWSGWSINTGYWTIDGVTGSGTSGYGFVVANASSGATVISIGNVTGVTLMHIEASASVTTCDTVTNLNAIIYAVAGGSNLLVQNNYFHESNSWGMIGLNGWNGATFDGNYFKNACRKELFSARNDTNLTIRNNIAENAAGTGIIVMENPSAVSIYNNIFFTTNPGTYNTTDCLICNWYGSGMNATNVFIYGNTFVNLARETVIGFDNGTNIVVENNVFYGSAGINWQGTVNHDYNWCYPSGACSGVASEAHGQIGAGSPFVNIAAGNFHLTSATAAGITLASPYNLDKDGNTRGAGGVWGRGAYEYVSGVASNAGPMAPRGLRFQ